MYKLLSFKEQEGYLPQTDHSSAFLVDHLKICLVCSLMTIQNLPAVSHTVCTHVGGSQTFGYAGARPWDRDMADTLEMLLPMCQRYHHIKFRHCRSNRLSIDRVHQKSGDAEAPPHGMWTWLLLPAYVTVTNSVILGHNV